MARQGAHDDVARVAMGHVVGGCRFADVMIVERGHVLSRPVEIRVVSGCLLQGDCRAGEVGMIAGQRGHDAAVIATGMGQVGGVVRADGIVK